MFVSLAEALSFTCKQDTILKKLAWANDLAFSAGGLVTN
jgi:hypothetical protein